MEKASVFAQIKSLIITTVSFLLPLFFLPITQEYFMTNKFYLLNLLAILLLILSGIEVFFSGKFYWRKIFQEWPLAIFIILIAISTFFIAPNPTQSLLNPHFNLLTIASLAIIYLHAIKTDILKTIVLPLLASSLIIASFTILNLFFKPFHGLDLPISLQFLKNAAFSPVGSQIDLAIFLGFIVALTGSILFELIKSPAKHISSSLYWVLLILNSAALLTVVYFIVKNQSLNALPPLHLSWYAGLEALKNPISALFGIGIDNFSTVFTRVKDIDFNQSDQWQIGSFAVSRSTYLHLMTEIGLLGLTAFILLIIKPLTQVFSKAHVNEDKHMVIPFIFLVAAMIFFPPSLIVFFSSFYLPGTS